MNDASTRAADLGLRCESAEVYYATGTVTRARGDVIEFLREQARTAPRRRCRLCLHASPASHQQEMLIVIHRDSFVAPHSHVGKDETMLVLEGRALAPLFDGSGEITDIIEMGDAASGRTFLYHMPEGVTHGLLLETEWLVYIETTVGPFRREATVFPDWTPDAADSAAVGDFRVRMERAIASHRRDASSSNR